MSHDVEVMKLEMAKVMAMANLVDASNKQILADIKKLQDDAEREKQVCVYVDASDYCASNHYPFSIMILSGVTATNSAGPLIDKFRLQLAQLVCTKQT